MSSARSAFKPAAFNNRHGNAGLSAVRVLRFAEKIPVLVARYRVVESSLTQHARIFARIQTGTSSSSSRSGLPSSRPYENVAFDTSTLSSTTLSSVVAHTLRLDGSRDVANALRSSTCARSPSSGLSSTAAPSETAMSHSVLPRHATRWSPPKGTSAWTPNSPA
eukprot:Amastigsp_a185439_4.p2 type:complete len:164 gc:universal Amastigsp_a185439_4:546-55(-)